jgi:hypothetical protein
VIVSGGERVLSGRRVTARRRILRLEGKRWRQQNRRYLFASGPARDSFRPRWRSEAVRVTLSWRATGRTT